MATPFKMKGSPAKLGSIQGTTGHASVLKAKIIEGKNYSTQEEAPKSKSTKKKTTYKEAYKKRDMKTYGNLSQEEYTTEAKRQTKSKNTGKSWDAPKSQMKGSLKPADKTTTTTPEAKVSEPKPTDKLIGPENRVEPTKVDKIKAKSDKRVTKIKAKVAKVTAKKEGKENVKKAKKAAKINKLTAKKELADARGKTGKSKRLERKIERKTTGKTKRDQRKERKAAKKLVKKTKESEYLKSNQEDLKKKLTSNKSKITKEEYVKKEKEKLVGAKKVFVGKIS